MPKRPRSRLGAKRGQSESRDVRDVLDTLRGLVTRPLEAMGLGGPSGALENLETDTPAALMDLWRRGLSVWTPTPLSAQDDHITSLGATTELVVKIPPIHRPRTEAVRFFLGAREVGVADYGDGPVAQLPVTVDQQGEFMVTFELLDKRRRVIRARQDNESRRLVVVDEEPVVAVDLDVILHATALVRPLLRALAFAQKDPWQLIYIDRGDKERRQLALERIAEADLPRAPLLTHLGESKLRALGPEHARTLLEAELRRLRADGVPVSMLLAFDDPLPEALKGDVVSVRVPRPIADDEGESMWDDETPPPTPLVLSASARERVLASRASLCQARRSAQAAISFRLDQMTPTHSVPGHDVVVELDNRAAREAVFAAIESSQHHVELQFYILEASDFTEHLAVHLIRAARRGVQVSLLVDALYSRQEVLGAVNPVLEGLKSEPGIDVRASKPILTLGGVDVRSMKERDHRKMILVDGELAFVSGRNAGDAYYSGFDEIPITDFTEHERIPWLDAHVQLRGPVVEAIRAAFQGAWAASSGEGSATQVGGAAEAGETARAHERERTSQSKTGKARKTGKTRKTGRGSKAPAPSACRLVLHDGVHDAYGLTAYEAMIDAAQERVYVVNAFPVIDRLRDTIARAVRRGVEVHLLTGCALSRRSDGSFFPGGLHRELFEYMLKQRLEGLLRAGVAVYEYETRPHPLIVARGGVVRPYVHAKILVADGQALSVGSANLDATASYWEREANIIVEGGAVPAEFEEKLREICARSHRLDLNAPAWQSEAAQRELVARLWPTSLYS